MAARGDVRRAALALALAGSVDAAASAPPPPASPRPDLEEKCLSGHGEDGQRWTEASYRACREILEATQPAGLTGGRTIAESDFMAYALWQAEIRSTYRYTKADIATDRALPPGDPRKYFLDRKAE